MDFEIPESLVKTLLGAIAAESPLARRLNEFGACHGSVTVPANLFDAHSLNTLYSLSKTNNERALMFQMLALDNIYNAPQARTIPALDKLVPGLVAYLAREAIDGWLYRRNKDGTLLPWLVQRLRYVEPDQGRPYVVIDLLANSMASANSERQDPQLRRSGMTMALVINRHDIVNRTIPELLAEFGFTRSARNSSASTRATRSASTSSSPASAPSFWLPTPASSSTTRWAPARNSPVWSTRTAPAASTMKRPWSAVSIP